MRLTRALVPMLATLSSCSAIEARSDLDTGVDRPARDAFAVTSPRQSESLDEAEPPPFPRPDPERDAGITLREVDDAGPGLRVRLPFWAGITEFSFESVSLDNLATVSLVPTLEGVLTIDEHWTLFPFLGLGGAYQTGARELVGGQRFLGLFQTGVRTQHWQPFARRYAWLVKAELRYDAVLNGRDGLLGDWGSVDAATEVRAILGPPSEEPRFQPGLYVQGIHYWQAVELELEGIAPEFIEDQLELGLSFGTNMPFEIAGFTVPRVFLGLRWGEDVRGFAVRFGRL